MQSVKLAQMISDSWKVVVGEEVMVMGLVGEWSGWSGVFSITGERGAGNKGSYALSSLPSLAAGQYAETFLPWNRWRFLTHPS